jgi:hypothetical protein
MYLSARSVLRMYTALSFNVIMKIVYNIFTEQWTQLLLKLNSAASDIP